MSQSEERGKWYWVRDELTGDVCIINPAGTEYEISESRLDRLDQSVVTLLNDMLDGLCSLQRENEALRERVAMLEGAAGADLTRMAERSRAVKADNRAIVAGYNAVIADLRAEVARLKGGSQGALLSGVADIAHCGGLASLSEADAITAIRKLTLTHFKKSRRVDQMKMDVLAALRAEGGAK